MVIPHHKSLMKVNVLYQTFSIETTLSIITVVYYQVVIKHSQSFKVHFV